jgi:hypothetical protein
LLVAVGAFIKAPDTASVASSNRRRVIHERLHGPAGLPGVDDHQELRVLE